MFRDVTLGQYFPGESWVHQLDARIKILASLVYIVSLFLVRNAWGFVPAFLYLLIVTEISRVPLRFLLRGLRPLFLILALTFFLNLFMTSGEIIWQWRFLHVTREGLHNAAFLVLRLLLLVLGSSLLTLTTKPMALTDGMESLLSPLKKIGFPAHELAMMMTIALRFIPTLMEETDKIRKAQQARGADFESGNLFARAKSLLPLLVPLFVSAFRIAQDLAMAMEARCYRGGEGRTRMNESKLSGRDGLAAILLAVYLAGILLSRSL